MNNRITKEEVKTLRNHLWRMYSDLFCFRNLLFSEGFPATALQCQELEYKLSRLATTLNDMVSIFPTEKEVKNVRQ